MQKLSFKNVGGPKTPHDIQRMRKENIDLLRRMGQPVVWKHMFSLEDLDEGYTMTLSGARTQEIGVKKCPACYDSEYSQVRADCKVCFGVGLVSIDNHPSQWIDDSGYLTSAVTATPAPRWGGYGPSVLTWVVQPDAVEDLFKITNEGVLVKIQNAQAYAPWTPDMNDNDLLINVDLSRTGFEIIRTNERYQLKMTAPQSIRGYGRYARGREYQVAQQFEMTLVPKPNIVYDVPADDTIIHNDTGSTAGAAVPSGVDEKTP